MKKKLLIVLPLVLSSNAHAMLKSQSQENLLQYYYEEHNNPHETVLHMNSAPMQNRLISSGVQERRTSELSVCEDCLLMAEESCTPTRARYTLICCSIPAFVCLFSGAIATVLLLAS